VPLLAGNALEDQSEEEAAGEGSSGRDLRAFVGDRGDTLLDGRAAGRRGLLCLGRDVFGHSGGSSPNTRIQMMLAMRVATSVASAPVPASKPDQSRRFNRGLSVIVADSIRRRGDALR
jgi:hypothetical protein